MRNKLGDEARLKHIFDAIIEIETYTLNVEYSEFTNNSMMIHACIKQLEIIGEASNHLTDDIKAKFSFIEWGQIIGMRNLFVHEYFGIDNAIVWDIISFDLLDLKFKIEEILSSL